MTNVTESSIRSCIILMYLPRDKLYAFVRHLSTLAVSSPFLRLDGSYSYENSFRHLLSHHLRPFSYLLISFTLLFVVADLMNNGEDFYHQSLSFKSILAYYQLQLPPLCLPQ